MMDEKNCSLIYTGEIVEGKTLEQVHEDLAAAFKTDIERIKRMFSKKGTVIRKSADRDTCLKMQKMIQDAGAVCVLDTPEEPQKEALPDVPADVVKKPSSQTRANPYAAPKADLKTPGDEKARGFTEPQKRPARNGVTWVMSGINLYLKAPFKWIGVFIVYFLASLIMVIPRIGFIIQSFLNPVYLGGIMRGARELDENDELSIGCVFQGFKNGFGQLVLLGLLMLVGIAVFFVIAWIISLTMGVSLLAFQSRQLGGFALILLVLIILSLFTPLMMAFWFSPALIAINGKTAIEAMSLSFKACLRNMLPFFVYSIVGFVVMLLFGFVVGVVSALVGGSGVSMFIRYIIFILLYFSTMLVMMMTVYTSYKDIFYKQ